MMGKKGVASEAKKKAERAMRKRFGWARSQWVNEMESALAEAFLLFCQSQLAERNGQRRHARRWAAEFERLLIGRIINIHVHPVKREFNRQTAFEDAVREMTPGTISALQGHVERQFSQVCKVRRGVDDTDVKKFWRRAREVARMIAA